MSGRVRVAGVVVVAEDLPCPGRELLVVGVVDHRDPGWAEGLYLFEQVCDAGAAVDGIELLGDEPCPVIHPGAEPAGGDYDQGRAATGYHRLCVG